MKIPSHHPLFPFFTYLIGRTKSASSAMFSVEQIEGFAAQTEKSSAHTVLIFQDGRTREARISVEILKPQGENPRYRGTIGVTWAVTSMSATEALATARFHEDVAHLAAALESLLPKG